MKCTIMHGSTNIKKRCKLAKGMKAKWRKTRAGCAKETQKVWDQNLYTLLS
jgi:hypothetical protein